jgi:hypothetical protein
MGIFSPDTACQTHQWGRDQSRITAGQRVVLVLEPQLRRRSVTHRPRHRGGQRLRGPGPRERRRSELFVVQFG